MFGVESRRGGAAGSAAMAGEVCGFGVQSKGRRSGVGARRRRSDGGGRREGGEGKWQHHPHILRPAAKRAAPYNIADLFQTLYNDNK